MIERYYDLNIGESVMDGFCKKYSKVITAVLLILTLMIIVPVVVGSGYTYLCEDDFSFEAGANDMARIWNSAR